MSKSTIMNGYIDRVGPDLGITKYQGTVDEILSPAFASASKGLQEETIANAAELASQLIETYSTNTDVQSAVNSGIAKLASSGFTKAVEAADTIQHVVDPSHKTELKLGGFEMK